MEQPVIVEALGREEIGIGGFVVGGEDEVAEIFRFAEGGMVVGDQFGAEIPGPVKDLPAVEGGEV